MLKTTTTTETGKTLKLWLDENSKGVKGTVLGLTENEEVREKKVRGYDCIKCGKTNHPETGEKVSVVIKLNDDIKDFLNKAKNKIENLKEKEIKLPLKVKIIETNRSGAWITQDLVLEFEDKLLSEKQREQIRKLKVLLGETALFAGASDRIKAKELPVEKGEQYKLSEIMEMLTKTKSYKRKEESEQKEKQKYEEAEKEARDTGNNVVINRFSVECNDPKEECSTDIITVYMTPSGRTKEERIHTY